MTIIVMMTISLKCGHRAHNLIKYSMSFIIFSAGLITAMVHTFVNIINKRYKITLKVVES